jgi:hypothetical protein
MAKSKKAKPAKTTKGKTRAKPPAPAAKKKPAKALVATGAVVGGVDPCVCGGAPEDHGRDPEYPGSTACTHCTDCIAYEADR